MRLLIGLSPLLRAQLLDAVRLAWATGLRDPFALQTLLYNSWFARAAPDAYDPSGGPDATEGWWVTWGTRGHAPPAMVRVYWNCPATSASELLAGIIQILEQRRVRYTLKCPTTPQLFSRVEPVVLYLGFAEWRAVKPALRALHQILGPQLRPPVPPLTLPLGRGAAVAEDPGDGRSFGESRAAAVADGVTLAASLGAVSEESALAVVAGCLPAHDISPVRPYLRRDSPPHRVTGW